MIQLLTTLPVWAYYIIWLYHTDSQTSPQGLLAHSPLSGCFCTQDIGTAPLYHREGFSTLGCPSLGPLLTGCCGVGGGLVGVKAGCRDAACGGKCRAQPERKLTLHAQAGPPQAWQGCVPHYLTVATHLDEPPQEQLPLERLLQGPAAKQRTCDQRSSWP